MRQITSIVYVLIIMLCSSMISIAHANNAPTITPDPFEGYNRAIFTFNRTFDRFLLKPVAKGYDYVLPNPVKKSIGNFFRNLDNVPNIINDLLQAKFYQATSDAWRLGINSTVGIIGLFDVASHMGLPHHKQDFGMTLHKWGYENSAYFILPFLGPRTVRDSIGLLADFKMYPVTYIKNVSVRNGLYILLYVSRRAELLPLDKVAEEVAFDRYTFTRDAYLQHRASVIRENESDGKATEAQIAQANDTYVSE